MVGYLWCHWPCKSTIDEDVTIPAGSNGVTAGAVQ